ALAMLRDMQQAARRASELVQQVLAISRHRDRSLELVGLPDIVSNLAHLLRRSAPPGVSVQAHVDSDAGRVLGDPAELEQAFVALGSRAITGAATARSRVRIALDLVDRFGGRWMRVCGEDDGPRLDDDARARFFDAGDDIPDPDGIASRLALARRIVSEHSGRIEVRLGDDGLNLVEVLLPIDAAEFGAETAKEPVAPAPAPQPLATDDARPGERILLVDDDPAVLEVARQMLEAVGYEVVACSGGAPALEWLRDGAERFDLILTDLTMPGMTGIELTHAAKAIRPAIPVVCCTGYGDERVERRAYEAGMAAFVRKPIEFELLSATIRKAIDGAARG
ncbi:MAG: response regulator, partial [Planctomycetota bacterium]